MVSFKDSSNKILQAFSYLLLKTIYNKELDEELLKRVKINLYGDETNLKEIQNIPISKLSNDQMKKLIV